MAIAAEQVKALRDQTGAGMMECKKALMEADGDIEKAVTLLRERGLAAAAKRSDRETREGIIGQYIHAGGRLGVLVEVDCETDFVASTEEFQELVRDVAMQIAASNPSHVRREDVGQEEIEREKEIYHNQAQSAGKPEKVMERIVEGKLNKYYSEVCLYEQPYIKDPELTVEELIKARIAVLKENISVKRFARFKVGE
jgi:elongation factor Ts